MLGELIFIGAGLSRDDISLKALSAAKSCDIIFAEEYTSRLSDCSMEELETIIGKKINVLRREEVEEEEIPIKHALTKKVAFIVAGDPMTATTHISLRIEAEKKGIKTKVIPGVSIYTAVPSILGLQHYKFGRTTTLVYPEENFFPLSPYYVIKENMERGLHTLVLLDINAEKNRLMTVREAIDILLEMESRAKNGVIKEDSLVCAVARAGAEDFIARAGTMKTLREENLGKPPHTMVIPGELHFTEKEALETLCGYREM